LVKAAEDGITELVTLVRELISKWLEWLHKERQQPPRRGSGAAKPGASAEEVVAGRVWSGFGLAWFS
jgi:hypothetical protein